MGATQLKPKIETQLSSEPVKIYETLAQAEKTVVLWVSRHLPLKKQIEVLESRLGLITIYQVQYAPNAQYIVDVATRLGARVIIPVIPLSMIAALTELQNKYGFTVLWAEMEHVKTVEKEPIAGVDYDPSCETVVVAAGAHEQRSYRIMRFKAFHRIKAIRLELEPW